MIQPQTLINIADNSGVKVIMCIRILGTKKKHASVGDTIIGVVKKALPNNMIQKSSIVRAVIVRTKKMFNRANGSHLKFDENAAVIITVDKTPKGTRVFGPIPFEIRDKGFSKVVALAGMVI